MARRCLCSRLIAALRDDPRLATLPLAARMLFLLVAEAASRSPEVGVLPFGDARRVSLLVSASETEVETQIETLLAEGLIRRAGHGLAVPLLVDAATRAEVARSNGSRGGRPRKGESAEDALRRRQGHMALPIAGGVAAGPETQETETQKPGVVSSTTTNSQVVSQSQEEGRSAREAAPAWVSLGEACAELAGMDPARGGHDFRPVQGWLAEGIAPETILAAVKAATQRASYPRGRVTTLAYFARPVAEAHARALVDAAPLVVPTASERAQVAALEARMDAVQLGRRLVA